VDANDLFVVRKGGQLIAVNPNDEKQAVEGDLLAEASGQGVKAKTAFQLLKEEASSKSLDDYAKTAGVTVKQIEALADEYTSHGKKAGVEFYRGPVQHTNGYYTAQALVTLNLLIGNVDWKGGLNPSGGSWASTGGKEGQPFDLGKQHTGKVAVFGLKVTREGTKYEATTLFKGYPAPRPFYPFTSNVYQEVIPAIDAQYPYPIKVLWLHKGTPALATPAGADQIRMLRDTAKVPLFIADDVLIGETSMYADYLFPDLTFAEALGTPGYGKDGFGPGLDFTRPEDYYLKAVANIAAGDKPGDEVPPADAEEQRIFREARKHFPPAVYDEAKWKRAVGDASWAKAVYVLNRGGRYEGYEKAYGGGYLGHPYGKLYNLYVEPVATTKDSIAGKLFSGIAKYEPIRHSDGTPVKDDDYPFYVVTYKEVIGGQSRTPGNYWSQVAVLAENRVRMHPRDVAALGLPVAGLVGLVLLRRSKSQRLPAVLVALILGLVVSLAAGALEGLASLRLGLVLPALGVPSPGDLWLAAVLLVVPQLPLTLGNAVVATQRTAEDYFGPAARKVTYRALLTSMGVANLAAGFLGGLPVCHGSGGLTAHYRFGARTGGSNLLIGGGLIALAIFVDGNVVPLLALIPYPVLGALLVFTGVQHGLLARDVRGWQEVPSAGAVAALGFATGNLALGFGLGLLLEGVFCLAARLPRSATEGGAA